MALDPASYAELWRLYDQTNGHLRPEFVLPVLFGESSFSPGAVNAGHYGINQIDGSQLTAMGISPSDYVTWPASRQLQRVAGPFFAAQDRSAGPIRSGTRLYQANFIPKSLNLAQSFQDVIAAQGGSRYGGQEDSFYRSNAGALDPSNTGRITVGSLAARITAQLRVQAVADAVNQAYALRPNEPPPAIAAPWTPTPIDRRLARMHARLHPTLGQAVDASPPEDPVFGNDYLPDGTYCGSGGCGLVTAHIAMVNKTQPWVFWAFGLSAAAVIAAAIYGLYEPQIKHSLAPLLRNPTRRSSKVQSLLFSRSNWDIASAKRWARSHNYKAGKVDVTPGKIRLRQHPPGRFSRMRTVRFGRGIQAIVGFEG